MKTFTCPRCNYTTNVLSHLKDHFNKKKPCENLNNIVLTNELKTNAIQNGKKVNNEKEKEKKKENKNENKNENKTIVDNCNPVMENEDNTNVITSHTEPIINCGKDDKNKKNEELDQSYLGENVIHKNDLVKIKSLSLSFSPYEKIKLLENQWKMSENRIDIDKNLSVRFFRVRESIEKILNKYQYNGSKSIIYPEFSENDFVEFVSRCVSRYLNLQGKHQDQVSKIIGIFDKNTSLFHVMIEEEWQMMYFDDFFVYILENMKDVLRCVETFTLRGKHFFNARKGFDHEYCVMSKRIERLYNLYVKLDMKPYSLQNINNMRFEDHVLSFLDGDLSNIQNECRDVYFNQKCSLIYDDIFKLKSTLKNNLQDIMTGNSEYVNDLFEIELHSNEKFFKKVENKKKCDREYPLYNSKFNGMIDSLLPRYEMYDFSLMKNNEAFGIFDEKIDFDEIMFLPHFDSKVLKSM